VTDKEVTYFVDTLFNRLWEGNKKTVEKAKKLQTQSSF